MRSVSRNFFSKNNRKNNRTHVTTGPRAARRADRAVTRVNRHLRRSDKKSARAREVALPARERPVLGTHRFCKLISGLIYTVSFPDLVPV